jgi:hypothetical protein
MKRIVPFVLVHAQNSDNHGGVAIFSDALCRECNHSNGIAVREFTLSWLYAIGGDQKSSSSNNENYRRAADVATRIPTERARND